MGSTGAIVSDENVRRQWSGLQLFARYAYPPNQRGYCGPADHGELYDYRTAGAVDAGLAQLAASFHGPWPYLNLMAHQTGIGGPFSTPIVEAYWVGNQILDVIDTGPFGNVIEERFKPRVGQRWQYMAEALPYGFPHHSFHVFVTYPWVGLLEESDRGEPLEILDRCRIRWGQVASVSGSTAVVNSRHLRWDGKQLYLSEPESESVEIAATAPGVEPPVAVGDWVSMHWGWVCERLNRRKLRNLRHYSKRQLDVTNEILSHPGPAIVLG